MDLRIQRNASISFHCGSNKSDPSIKMIGTASRYDYFYLCTAKCSAHTLHTHDFLKCTEIYVYIRKIHIHTRTSLETSEMFCHIKLDVSNI